MFNPVQAELTRVRRLLVAAAERGEAGTTLIERAKAEDGQDAPPLDPQQLEKELLLAREAVSCKYLTECCIFLLLSSYPDLSKDPLSDLICSTLPDLLHPP